MNIEILYLLYYLKESLLIKFMLYKFLEAPFVAIFFIFRIYFSTR